MPGPVRLISTTSYFHRDDQSDYEGTLYNLSYYQSSVRMKQSASGPGNLIPGFPLHRRHGMHLPAGLTNYRSPNTVTNQQRNFTEELRAAIDRQGCARQLDRRFFMSLNRQFSFEQIHDPMADVFNQEFGTTDRELLRHPPPIPDGSSVSAVRRFLFQSAGQPRPAIRRLRRSRHQPDRQAQAAARRAHRLYAVLDPEPVGRPAERRPKSGQQFREPDAGHAQAGPVLSGQSRQSVLRHLRQGFPARRRQSERAGWPVCGQDFINLASRRADHLQIRYRAELRGRRQEQHQSRVQLDTSIYYIKWNDIQQNVVPPICEIQWTQNLGQAVSKGFDIQADFDLGSAPALNPRWAIPMRNTRRMRSSAALAPASGAGGGQGRCHRG
jgi:iron complex outermembrane receptor protein